MADHDYEAGLRDGKIEALEKMQAQHNARMEIFDDRFDKCDARLRLQEKITYGLLGAIALVEFLPQIKALVI